MDDALPFPPLPPRYDAALRGIVAWIRTAFAARAIVVSGSIVRGHPDAGSDLDLLVVHGEPWRQRVQRVSAGVACEVFVNPPARLRASFVEEQRDGRPCAAHMLASGWTILDRDDLVPALRAEAEGWLARGPTATEERLTALKYRAADLVENARDVVARDPASAAWFAGMAIEPILQHWLLAAGRLVPRRKELLPAVRALDRRVGDLALAALGEAAPAARVRATVDLAERCLGVIGFFPWESAREPC